MIVVTLNKIRTFRTDTGCPGNVCRGLNIICSIAFAILAGLNCSDASAIQTDETDAPPNSALRRPVKPESEQITEAQRRMAKRYKLLEDKLFTLYEYERDQNPMRSKILKRAYQQSQEKIDW